jgi:hypothetical protein
MKPGDLRLESFASYPPEARTLAAKYLAAFQRMPIILLALILREVIQYDWSFPAEREKLTGQLDLLVGMTGVSFAALMSPFNAIPLPNQLSTLNWANQPQSFSEKLTAYLWTQHLIDDYHNAAQAYQTFLVGALPQARPVTPRWTFVVIGRGSPKLQRPLFRPLATHGTLFTQLDSRGALEVLEAALRERAHQYPMDYGHWYIDGGELLQAEAVNPRVTSVSYNALVPAAKREFTLLNRFSREAGSQSAPGPEAVGSFISGLSPEDLDLTGTSSDAPLRRFQVNLITQGAGCQIFSTTFVQWAARECLHRAQPLTLFARFATRQCNAPMEQLLIRDPLKQPQDAEGSLIDADMGAYYTWINQSRLPGAEEARFLAWFEGQSVACAISPTLPEGTSSSQSINMGQILKQMA